jgi:monofunctional glycosyltransferase
MKNKIIKFLYVFVFINIGYILITKWILPPITFTQIAFISQYYNDTITLQKKSIKYGEMSINIKKAVIAGEDLHFFKHWGFDWWEIKKAFDSNKAKKWKNPIGSSSISQQTAKNIFLWQGGGFFRKIPEAIYTVLIEMIWGKKRILEIYLNEIEMGKGIFGIEAAAQAYFKKSAKYLTKEESIMIVTCLPNPKKYQPDQINLDENLTLRYNKIMSRFETVEVNY